MKNGVFWDIKTKFVPMINNGKGNENGVKEGTQAGDTAYFARIQVYKTLI
jgi:hypothetical protein